MYDIIFDLIVLALLVTFILAHAIVIFATGEWHWYTVLMLSAFVGILILYVQDFIKRTWQ